jgi:pyruvate dehydrogenase E2 component (dihydrolipoamide acetyltransferase)
VETLVATDFTLPELGENVAAGDVLRVLVKPGDTVSKDQPVLELETDKATIEVPSTVAGRVKDVRVKPGDKVVVGQPILTVEESGEAAAETPASGETAEPSVSEAPAEEKAAPMPAGGGPTAAAGGADASAYVSADEERLEQHVPGRRRDAGRDRSGVSKETVGRAADARHARPHKVVDISRGARQTTAAPELPVAPAAPSVRRMARELGVDIDQVSGSGPGGRISVEDVKAHAKRIVTGAPQPAVGAAAALPDFSRWGETERQPMRAVRRKTAEHLSVAWATIPHVTQHDAADITGLEELRKEYAKQVEAAGGNLTVTAIATKVIAAALRVFPQFNASLDLAAGEIVYKKYVNIGIAVDTDRGLLVPVIRDADAKNITELSVEIAQLSEKARSRKITLEEMQGGCFSISNLGGIGGTWFTPIVNAPEVAILGISRARMEPVYEKESGSFVPRLILPLSLSYDHRVIDGADGIRFLRWVVEALEQPFLLALNG